MNNNRHINYIYSVEQNATSFKIELRLYMHATYFGPFSGHHQARPWRKQQACFAQNPCDATWMYRNAGQQARKLGN